MADPEPSDTAIDADLEPAPKAPKFGCIMLILLFAFLTGAMIFALVQGGRMYREVVAFTDDAPVEIPMQRGTPEELEEIRARVSAFIEATKPKEPAQAELALSARDLNILIANDNYLGDLRGRFYVEAIEDSGLIRTVSSQPLPKIVFWKPRRYLNGEIDFQVESGDGQLFLREAELRVPGGTIAEGIRNYRRTLDLLTPYKEDERFEAVVAKIKGSQVENGRVIVSTTKLPESVNNPAKNN